MPAQPKQDTLARLLELLQAIPHRRYATAEELVCVLNNRGYPVHLRTVQRDLQLLREHLPLEVQDDSKPHGWGWKHQAPDGITGMGAAEALMVVLVEQHLEAALPSSMLEGFKPTFERAHRRLAKLGQRAGTAAWPDKVRAVSPGLTSLPPQMRDDVRVALSNALLEERQVDCRYAPPSRTEPTLYRLHPVGLVLRGNVTYLLATRGAGTSPRYFALHRFLSVEVRTDKVHHPPYLTLDEALSRAGAQFGVPASPDAMICLRITCDKITAGHLDETPLAADQRVSRGGDERVEISATVADSWELRWWLLSRSAHVEVLGPRR